MGIRVIKVPDWRKYTKRIKKTDDKLQSMANDIIVQIINRTEKKGVDKNMKKFKEYTSKYAKRKGVSRSSVNLVKDNTMLHAMNSKKIKGGIRLYFLGTAEAAKAHGNQIKYKRKFFGLDKSQMKTIKGTIGKFIVKTKR